MSGTVSSLTRSLGHTDFLVHSQTYTLIRRQSDRGSKEYEVTSLLEAPVFFSVGRYHWGAAFPGHLKYEMTLINSTRLRISPEMIPVAHMYFPWLT